MNSPIPALKGSGKNALRLILLWAMVLGPPARAHEVQPTNTPVPTSTFTSTRTPTRTPTRTWTPTPTRTNTPTWTYTPTNTYTPINTYTPTPFPTPQAIFQDTKDDPNEVSPYDDYDGIAEGNIFWVYVKGVPDNPNDYTFYRKVDAGGYASLSPTLNYDASPLGGFYFAQPNSLSPGHYYYKVAVQSSYQTDEDGAEVWRGGIVVQTNTPTPSNTSTFTPTYTPTPKAPFQSSVSIASSLDGPRSVCTGDINGDGHDDIVYAVYDGGEIGWIQSNGDGTFEAARVIDDSATGAYSVSLGYLDSDVYLDVVAALHTGNQVIWYENQPGDGTPTWVAHIIDDTTAGSPTSVAVVDLNGDSWSDVITSAWNGKEVLWYKNVLGVSDTFVRTVIHDYGTVQPQSAFPADLNGDEVMDVAVTLYDGDTVEWISNLDGTFSATSTVISSQLDGPRGAFGADLDADGYIDGVIASTVDYKDTWFENDGESAPSFSSNPIATSQDGAYDVRAEDIDNDGDMDVVVAADNSDSEKGDVVWFENSFGDGSEWIARTLATTDSGARSVQTCDLDEDGDPDIIAALYNEDEIVWYENSWPSPTPTPVMACANLVPNTNISTVWSTYAYENIDDPVSVPGLPSDDAAVADEDDDGEEQIWGFTDPTSPQSSSVDNIYVYVYGRVVGDPDAVSARVRVSGVWSDTESLELGTSAGWYGLLFAGSWSMSNLDTLEVGFETGTMPPGDEVEIWSVYCSCCGLAFTPTPTSTFTHTPTVTSTPTAFADAEAVWQSEQIQSASDDDIDRIELGNPFYVKWGSNLPNAPYLIKRKLRDGWPESITPTPVYDSNDGEYYFIESASTERGYYTYNIRPGTPYAGISDEGTEPPEWKGGIDVWDTLYNAAIVAATGLNGPRDMLVADFDYDYDPDIVVAEYDGGRVLWLENNGDATFATAEVIDASMDGAICLDLFDVNDDSLLDVVAAASDEGRLMWYENILAATVTEWASHTIDAASVTAPECIVTADVDWDGDNDFVVADPGTGQVLWYETVNMASDSYAFHVIYDASPGRPTTVAIGDLNGDARPDVIFGQYEQDVVRWIENLGNGAFSATPETVSASVDGVRSIVPWFMDDDMALDILVTAENAGRVLWYANSGSATSFAEYTLSASLDSPRDIYCENLDSDGDFDFVIGTYNTDPAATDVAWIESLMGLGETVFGERDIVWNASGVVAVGAGDMDQDGDMDTVAALYLEDRVVWFPNTLPTPTPTLTPLYSPTPTPTETTLGGSLNKDKTGLYAGSCNYCCNDDFDRNNLASALLLPYSVSSGDSFFGFTGMGNCKYHCDDGTEWGETICGGTPHGDLRGCLFVQPGETIYIQELGVDHGDAAGEGPFCLDEVIGLGANEAANYALLSPELVIYDTSDWLPGVHIHRGHTYNYDEDYNDESIDVGPPHDLIGESVSPARMYIHVLDVSLWAYQISFPPVKTGSIQSLTINYSLGAPFSVPSGDSYEYAAGFDPSPGRNDITIEIQDPATSQSLVSNPDEEPEGDYWSGSLVWDGHFSGGTWNGENPLCITVSGYMGIGVRYCSSLCSPLGGCLFRLEPSMLAKPSFEKTFTFPSNSNACRSIEILEVWSNQRKGADNNSNYMPGGSGNIERHKPGRRAPYILMTVNGTGTSEDHRDIASVKANFEVCGDAGPLDSLWARLRRVNEVNPGAGDGLYEDSQFYQPELRSMVEVDEDKNIVTFDATITPFGLGSPYSLELFQIQMWFDDNNNYTLDDAEEPTLAKSPYVFCIVDDSYYDISVASLKTLPVIRNPANYSYYLYHHLATGLYEESVLGPSERLTDVDWWLAPMLTKNPFRYMGKLGLAHNVGVNFTPGDPRSKCHIEKWIYNSDHSVIKALIEQRSGWWNTSDPDADPPQPALMDTQIKLQKQFREAVEAHDMPWEDAPLTVPMGTEFVFPLSFPATFSDIGAAFGKVLVTKPLELKLRVEKTPWYRSWKGEYFISSITVESGQLSDIFDFDVETWTLSLQAGPASKAAAVQAGYGTLGTGGPVKLIEINFQDNTASSGYHPFLYFNTED